MRRAAFLIVIFTATASAVVHAQDVANPPIRLRARQFVPGDTGSLTLGDLVAQSSGRHFLIQFTSEPTPEFLAALPAEGVHPLRYVPDHAIVATVDSPARLASIPGVRWLDHLQPTDKVSDELRFVRFQQGIAAYVVMFHPDVDRVAQADTVAHVGGHTRRLKGLADDELLVEVTPMQMQLLVTEDAVAWVYQASEELIAGGPVNRCPSATFVSGLQVAEYAVFDSGWDGGGLGQASLSYYFGNGAGLGGAEWQVVERALQEWARYAALKWTRVGGPGYGASVDVNWVGACHAAPGDWYDDPCFSPNTLAHAFFPSAGETLAGDLHLNAQNYAWKIGGASDSHTINVFDVALHELGHSLGVAHTSDPSAVMYPYLEGRTFSGLMPDDIRAIQSIYRAAPYCEYAVSPRTRSVPASAGTAEFSVDTLAACPWTAGSSAGWLRVIAPVQRAGAGVIGLTVDNNTQSVARSATATVAGVAVTVTQDAAPCSYVASPSSISIGYAGATASVSVATASNCAWTVRSLTPWVSVRLLGVGTGSGAVEYVAQINPSFSPRSGTLSIAGQSVSVTQAGSSDADRDGMPDGWESLLGLNVGTNDAALDPDGDGKSNYAEYLAGTHPRCFLTRHMAEGATAYGFESRLALFNPGDQTARVNLRFLRASGGPVAWPTTIPPRTRRTVDPTDVPGMSGVEFSTVLESDVLVVADRTMTWGNGSGSHAETAVLAPATQWYLAEGATHSNFDLFYLLQNPNGAAAQIEVQFLLPGGVGAAPYYVTVAANSRYTLWVDSIAGLGNTDVSAVIRVLNGQPIIVERAMYLSTATEHFAAGHDSAAVPSPSPQWFLAEGATGPNFDMFVLLANPTTAWTTADVTYLIRRGGTLTKRYGLAPRSRYTIWVDNEDLRLANSEVSVQVRTLDGAGIIVERAMWWPGGPGQWIEAHNSPGTTVTGTKWALAEGEVRGGRNLATWILVANTSTFAGTVRLTLYDENGVTASKTFAIGPQTRETVGVHDDPTFAAFVASGGTIGKRFGAILESLGTTPAQIVVERAMYSDAAGVHWAAGTDALATKLQ